MRLQKLIGSANPNNSYTRSMQSLYVLLLYDTVYTMDSSRNLRLLRPHTYVVRTTNDV